MRTNGQSSSVKRGGKPSREREAQFATTAVCGFGYVVAWYAPEARFLVFAELDDPEGARLVEKAASAFEAIRAARRDFRISVLGMEG